MESLLNFTASATSVNPSSLVASTHILDKTVGALLVGTFIGLMYVTANRSGRSCQSNMCVGSMAVRVNRRGAISSSLHIRSFLEPGSFSSSGIGSFQAHHRHLAGVRDHVYDHGSLDCIRDADGPSI